jgi:formate dehydrogenase accessory protein FdhE
MTQTKVQSQWDRRIGRANDLIGMYPFAAEGLRFYAQVAELQGGLYDHAASLLGSAAEMREPLPLREQLARLALAPRIAQFAAEISKIAPEPLADAAALLAHASPEECRLVVDEFLGGELAAESPTEEDLSFGGSSGLNERLVVWLCLQPFAEYVAERRDPPKFDSTPSSCPVCGGNPIVGVLRPEGDGGKKSLICMLCAHEWAFRRIYCPACGEQREPQMGFYTAPEIAQVRVDVCDTCHTYLKTVDLTKMGRAVPVVDELATIPLDLWAREHGYEKLQINLLGA